MRRLAAVLVLGTLMLATPASAAAPGVKNPMQADLDGNHFQIVNLAGIDMNGSETNIGANYVATHELLLSVQPGPLNDPIVTVVAGSGDPAVAYPTLGVGSFYLRSDGTFWGKTATGWRQLAFAP